MIKNNDTYYCCNKNQQLYLLEEINLHVDYCPNNEVSETSTYSVTNLVVTNTGSMSSFVVAVVYSVSGVTLP